MFLFFIWRTQSRLTWSNLCLNYLGILIHVTFSEELFGLNYIYIQFSILYLMMLITNILIVLVKTKKKCKNINVNCIHDSATCFVAVWFRI